MQKGALAGERHGGTLAQTDTILEMGPRRHRRITQLADSRFGELCCLTVILLAAKLAQPIPCVCCDCESATMCTKTFGSASVISLKNFGAGVKEFTVADTCAANYECSPVRLCN